MEFGNDILTLVDEDGEEHEFEVVDTLELNEERYLALVPVLENEEDLIDDSGELILLKVNEVDDGEYLEPIDDENEFNKISKIFMERLEEIFDFEDDDDSDDEEDDSDDEEDENDDE